MNFSILVDVYENLESTTKKLKKTEILANLYKNTEKDIINKVVLLSMGIVYPKGKEDLGIAQEMMQKAIQKAFGIDSSLISKKFKEYGDLGLVAENFAKKKKQMTLIKKILTVENVFDELRRLPKIVGEGSQEKKLHILTELLIHAKPKEAKYIVRIVLGKMRIGVAEGIVRDAISKAFNVDAELVEQHYNILGDYGSVSKQILEKGLETEVKIKIGSPIRVMLAERAPNLKYAMNAFENKALEIKLDGFRAQIHKNNKKLWIFSRRMEDVTHQFPEVVEWLKIALKTKKCIVEGEIIAIDKKTGKPLPFQTLSRRIQRKYDIEKMVSEIPVQLHLFDCLLKENKNLMHVKLKKRWNVLKTIVNELKDKVLLVEHIETNDIEKAKKFYQYALSIGEEGVMVKNLDAHYQPGKRVGYWLKVKPIMEPLDLVIIGGKWGTGKRAKWVGSVMLGARKDDIFLSTGMLGSGLTEDQMKELTKRIKPLIIEEKGSEFKVKPKIVIEVAYEEIQKSPKYETGYALRFPRLLRFREDEKTPKDADTINTIKKLYKQQFEKI